MDLEAPVPSGSPSSLDLANRLAAIAQSSRPAGALRDTAAQIRGHMARGRRGLAICGAASGAGVSFVTASLALILAQSGVRTLVIEANLRSPTMRALIPAEGDVELGLSSFLSGEASDPSEVLRSDVLPNLSVIYAGSTRADAADLFDTDRFEQLMRYALRSYDLTLIDTPAANRCAETRRIAAVAGYAAIVARRDVTMAEDLATLVADLRLDRTEVIGSIFNEG